MLSRLQRHWNRRRADRRSAERLYHAAVDRARHPHFYTVWGVPDTPENRFELISLHVFLLWRALRRHGEVGGERAQRIVDLYFADLDRNLREMGVGDLSVGKHVKRLAASFLARTRDLGAGLDAGDRTCLETVLTRNLDGGEIQVTALAAYALAEDVHLAALDAADLLEGRGATLWRPAGTAFPSP